MRDWEIVECRVWCQKVGPRFLYHTLKLGNLSNNTYSYHSKKFVPNFHKFYNFTDFFWIVRLRLTWHMYQLQLMIEKSPIFWHPTRHSTISQSRTISSHTSKCSNLAQAGAKAYETAGNRRVKSILFKFKSPKSETICTIIFAISYIMFTCNRLVVILAALVLVLQSYPIRFLPLYKIRFEKKRWIFF